MEKTKLEEAIASLTTKEISTIEKKTGTPFDALERENAIGKVALFCGLAWMLAVKNGVTATYDEYANRPFTEVAEELGISDDED